MKYLKHIRTARYKNQTKSYGKYLCQCGKEKIVRDDHIRSGRTISCGCLAKMNAATHGKSGTRVYQSWLGMLARSKLKVFTSKNYNYKNVVVCDRWRSFENFYEDMGIPPTESHEIDRINPLGGYTPGNCRWATRSEQMLNQIRNRKIYQEYLKLSPVVSYATYRNRLRAGWNKSKSASTPKMTNQFR